MRGLRLITLAAIPVLVLSACSSSNASPTTQSAVTNVKWFVGLGTGTSAAQIQPQDAWVNNYNSTNKDGIKITLDIVTNSDAFNTLKTDIAAGNAPDIIGPIGVKGRSIFKGLLLDLTSEIAKQKFDLAQYDPNVIAAIKTEGTGLVALPYSVYPGYVWYNKDIFSAAGLPNLPTKIGDQYQGKDWTYQTMGDVAAQLTVDSNGKKSTDAAFDPTKITQYGLGFQWASDLKRIGDMFGSGNLVAADGKTAQIPAAWASGLQWYYDALQVKHIIPDTTASASAVWATGNLQSTGHVAMNMAWSWSLSSIASVAAGKANTAVKTWDIGVWPSWNGVVSAPADIDGFALSAATKNPDQAFKAMQAITSSPDLDTVYGASPALISQQAAYYKALDTSYATTFPTNGKITWSVLAEDYKHIPAISHEAWMPDYNAANSDANALLTKLQSTSGVNLTTELATLTTKLQADFASNPQ
jgi:multiple sugar transport system substrate-binding protein